MLAMAFAIIDFLIEILKHLLDVLHLVLTLLVG